MPAPHTLQPIHVTCSAYAPPVTPEGACVGGASGDRRGRGHPRGQRELRSGRRHLEQVESVPFGLSSLYVYQ